MGGAGVAGCSDATGGGAAEPWLSAVAGTAVSARRSSQANRPALRVGAPAKRTLGARAHAFSISTLTISEVLSYPRPRSRAIGHRPCPTHMRRSQGLRSARAACGSDRSILLRSWSVDLARNSMDRVGFTASAATLVLAPGDTVRSAPTPGIRPATHAAAPDACQLAMPHPRYLSRWIAWSRPLQTRLSMIGWDRPGCDEGHASYTNLILSVKF